jgi:hypothetical protein
VARKTRTHLRPIRTANTKLGGSQGNAPHSETAFVRAHAIQSQIVTGSTLTISVGPHSPFRLSRLQPGAGASAEIASWHPCPTIDNQPERIPSATLQRSAHA